jgi:hypothetical protein
MTQMQTTAFATEGSLVGPHPDYEAVEAGFGTPFVDVDEWRDAPRRHRYVHGGFEGTHTLFSIYLPPGESFDGRLLKHLEGGSGGHEFLIANDIGMWMSWMFDFCYDEFGAILMESNQGHYHDEGIGFHDDVVLFGASAESARFAKWLAPQLYGQPVEHAYVFGASGGGHRSYQCLMHRGDVFDGGVPEVCGANPGAYWSVQALAIELLGDKLVEVADRCEVGGSGDPFDGLTYDQREALADLFRMGYPRAAVNQLQTLAAPFTLNNTKEYNPSFFEDFWSKTGYLGHDDPERLAKRRVRITAKVQGVVDAGRVKELDADHVGLQTLMAGAAPQARAAVKLDVDDPQRFYMAWLTVKTGKAAGRRLVAMHFTPDGAVVPFLQMCPEMFDGVEAGDEVEIDNSDWIALTHLYKHNIEWNVPGLHTPAARVPAEYSDFAFDGIPIHTQTGEILYDLNTLVPFTSKMIVIAAHLDVMIWPTFITPLERHLRMTQGERADDTMRLYWVENATHGPPMGMGAMSAITMLTRTFDPFVWPTRLVEYQNAAKHALVDVAAWVEGGVAPPPDTRYSMTRNNQLELPAEAAQRRGIQPVVTLRANGGVRAEVKVGEAVRFEGTAEQPPGVGLIAQAEMDFLSDNTWPKQAEIGGGAAQEMTMATTYAFDKPGTYFPSFRVGAWRDGAGRTGLPIQNLARVRVVVTA